MQTHGQFPVEYGLQFKKILKGNKSEMLAMRKTFHNPNNDENMIHFTVTNQGKCL